MVECENRLPGRLDLRRSNRFEPNKKKKEKKKKIEESQPSSSKSY
jgi:hypothetical protein